MKTWTVTYWEQKGAAAKGWEKHGWETKHETVEADSYMIDEHGGLIFLVDGEQHNRFSGCRWIALTPNQLEPPLPTSDEILDALIGMVAQHCQVPDGDGLLWDLARSANEEALNVLERLKLVEQLPGDLLRWRFKKPSEPSG